MKCKDCDCAKKGFFSSQPEAYVCTGVKEPFVIGDINSECTEYESKRNMKMTREEAIKIVRFSNVLMYKNPELKEALDMAIADMEKQIPKKPTETNEKEYGSFYRLDFMCPSCNTSVIGQPYKPNNCKHCGQALDWSEEND